MNTTVKKAAPKKKAAQAVPTKSLIKYADACLKPKDGFILHSLYLNNPDKMEVFPKCMFQIHTGLEIAVPSTMVMVTHLNLINAAQIGGMHFGYQKELIIRGYNLTNNLLEIDPYQVIGSMFLTEIKPWK